MLYSILGYKVAGVKAWIAALREATQIGMLHVNDIAGSKCYASCPAAVLGNWKIDRAVLNLSTNVT